MPRGSTKFLGVAWLVVTSGCTALVDTERGFDSAAVSEEEEYAQAGYLKSPGLTSGGGFGFPVTLTDGLLSIAASGDDVQTDTSLIPGAGRSYSYDVQGARWLSALPGASRQPQANGGRIQVHIPEFFGTLPPSVSVATSSDTFVLGMGGESDETAGSIIEAAGAVYVFVRDGATSGWDFAQRLTAPDERPLDGFGFRVLLSGNVLVVSAPFDDGPDVDGTSPAADRDIGAAYVFENHGSGFENVRTLAPTSDDAGGLFGMSLAMDDDRLFVGAPRAIMTAAKPSAGAVHVYRRADWTLEKSLTPSTDEAFELFGVSVASSGDRIVVGAPGVARPGDVYVYDRDFAELQHLSPQTVVTAEFGFSVALTPALLLVGAPFFGGDESTFGPGAAFLYRKEGARFASPGLIRARNGEPNDGFGASVALDDAILAISAPTEGSADPKDPSNDAAVNSGAVYLFSKTTQ